MSGLDAAGIVLFDGFRFDRRARALYRMDRAGRPSLVSLGTRGLDLLALLVGRKGELVRKDEIIATVWAGRVVEEANLNVQISKLRLVLDQNRAEGSCIQTVIGYGYRFTAEVTPVESAAIAEGREPTDHDADGATENPRVRSNISAADKIIVEVPLAVSTQRRFGGTAAVPLIGALGLITIFLIAAFSWQSSGFQEARLKTPPLSIVVLPFTNLGSDRHQQYLTDGMARDLITDLSRIKQIFVISYSTSLTYRDKPVGAKQIGGELGVRYVLEGSVQHSGQQLRINVQLSDAESGLTLWAERFDRDTDDPFAVQNDITRHIAVALNRELVVAEAARPNGHPDALYYVLRGRSALMKPAAGDNRGEAIGLFERALALEPQSVMAQSWLARTLATRTKDRLTASAAADMARAETLVGKALAAAPHNVLAHYARGTVLRAQDRFQEAIPEYQMAIEFNRNWLDAYANLGQCKFYTGSLEEYTPLVEQAIRLSPRDSLIGVWFGRIGLAHLLQSHIDEAIYWLEKARSADPGLPYVHSRLAAAHALDGDTGRANAELAEARRLSGDDRYSSIAQMSNGYLGVPKIRSLFEDVYFAGLRLAGMPEGLVRITDGQVERDE
jgi:TolB-like protein/DNA-binding winged helix-turn-helix (wHTH) protein/Flp pilus assembly protein TadD